MSKTFARAVQLFLLALSVLALQVTLTRVFSFITFHHFSYLVISIAMLGFGAAGTWLTTRAGQRSDNVDSASDPVKRHAVAYALTMLLAIVYLPRISFSAIAILQEHDFSQLLGLLAIIVLTALPFFHAGICIGYILSRGSAAVNRLYFADLCGAAFGCLAALGLISALGAVGTVCVLAAVALLVALVAERSRWWCYAGPIGMLLLAGVLLGRRELLPMRAPDGKQMFRMEREVEYTKWHAVTRLDVTRPLDGYYSFGGALSPKYPGEPQHVRLIYQDGSALTGIIHPTPSVRETPSLGYYLQGAPYVVRPGAETLVVGCGGGVDVLIALYNGARRVVGVDLNPDMVALVRDRYRDFAGGLAQREDVELLVAEARHFLSRDPRQFDVIQLSGVDTFAALATGAYALSESYVYTGEAMQAYLEHLKPDGIVNISRPLTAPPREILRLVATQLLALERAGAAHPEQHLLIVSGQGRAGEGPWAQVMLSRATYTREEVVRLNKWARELGFEVLYDPWTPRSGDLETLVRAGPAERTRLLAAYPFDVRPITDDRPFYFQFFRWRNLWEMVTRHASDTRPPVALLILLGSLVWITVLSAAFIVYPLRRSLAAVARSGGRLGVFVYFAALGLGFMLVEIALVQKLMVFLGGPTYSMAITLFTILLASGLGSAAANRGGANPVALLRILVPVLVVLLVAEPLVLDGFVPRLSYLSLIARAAVVCLLVGPVAFCMGMPFPTGLRYVDRFRPELTPWAWGINACATVAGAILCTLISMEWGFRVAFWVAAGVYLLGGAALLRGRHQTVRRAGAAEPAGAAAVREQSGSLRSG
jgi:SAM-dependent methyltransferase